MSSADRAGCAGTQEVVPAGLVRTLRSERHPALGVGRDSVAEYALEDSGQEFAAERAGINLWSEYGLHAQLKLWAAQNLSRAARNLSRAARSDAPSPRFEVPVLGRVVDLVLPDGEIVEIQTSKLGSIQEKAIYLAGAGHRVRIIHPVIARSVVVRLDPETGEVLSRRKSPKRRDFWSVFDEMVHAPLLLSTPGIVVEVLSVEVEDLRMLDGAGSWRRKGDSLLDRRLSAVRESRVMACPADWLALLPAEEGSWTTESLSESLGIATSAARKILYTFTKAGYLAGAGKAGRFKRYCRA